MGAGVSEIFGLLSSLLNDISQGKTLRTALAVKSKITEICVCLLGGLAPSACPSLLFPESYNARILSAHNIT